MADDRLADHCPVAVELPPRFTKDDAKHVRLATKDPHTGRRIRFRCSDEELARELTRAVRLYVVARAQELPPGELAREDETARKTGVPFWMRCAGIAARRRVAGRPAIAAARLREIIAAPAESFRWRRVHGTGEWSSPAVGRMNWNEREALGIATERPGPPEIKRRARALLRKSRRSGGRPDSVAAPVLVRRMVRVFERATGRDPRDSRPAFLRFVLAVVERRLEPFGPAFADDLPQLVRAVL